MNMLVFIISGSSLLVGIYLLFIPVGISYQYCTQPLTSGPIIIRFYPFTMVHRGKSRRKPSHAVLPGREKTKPQRKFWGILLDDSETFSQVARVCLQFIKGLVRRKYHFAKVSLRGGLGAPDVTGMVAGLLEAVKPFLGKTCTLLLHPDFTTELPQGCIKIEAGFQIYGILLESLWLFGRMPKIKLIRIYRKISKRS